MRILVDHREPTAVIDKLRLLGVSVELQQLGLGDYVLSDDVVVERKTGRDFVQSLYDNRLFSQAHELMENYDQVIYILEDFYVEPHEYKHIFGAMSYLTIHRGIPVVPSYDHVQTAHLIERMCSWVQEEHQDPILSRVSPRRMSLEERQEFLLQGLEGVGNKTAKLLLQELGTPQRVFEELKKTQIVYTRTGNPKGISGKLGEVRGVGPKFVENNQPILGVFRSGIDSD